MNWKEKLSSRKLWAAIVGVLMGIAMVFGLDRNVVNTVAGAATVVGSVVVYIITEGKIDAEAVKDAIDSVGEVIEILGEDEGDV